MFITKKALSRRTILRGMGATLALPLLDGMVPALTAVQKPTLRFGAIYVPNGIIMPNWIPEALGPFELTPILQPIAAFRNQMTIVSGLDGFSGHGNASCSFLCDVPAANGAEVLAGISADQHLAKAIGQETKLPSLEMGLEMLALVGNCESASCAYYETLSYSSPTTPLPVECNPREVFERLFGDADSADQAGRLARIKQKRSLLDSLTDDVVDLQRAIGKSDHAKVTEYLDSVREVERRIQKAEADSAQIPTDIEAPLGAPAQYGEHAKLMFDLWALAYQSDSTRVGTLMMGREFSNRRYPEAGVPDPHHSTTHHPDVVPRMANTTKINAYHVSLFAHFLDRLAKTPDGDGSLLDHSIIVYGAGLSDGNFHDGHNLPIALLGNGGGTLRGGRHVHYNALPLGNLHLALMDKFGVRVEKIGNSTGRVEGLTGV